MAGRRVSSRGENVAEVVRLDRGAERSFAECRGAFQPCDFGGRVRTLTRMHGLTIFIFLKRRSSGIEFFCSRRSFCNGWNRPPIPLPFPIRFRSFLSPPEQEGQSYRLLLRLLRRLQPCLHPLSIPCRFSFSHTRPPKGAAGESAVRFCPSHQITGHKCRQAER